MTNKLYMKPGILPIRNAFFSYVWSFSSLSLVLRHFAGSVSVLHTLLNPFSFAGLSWYWTLYLICSLLSTVVIWILLMCPTYVGFPPHLAFTSIHTPSVHLPTMVVVVHYLSAMVVIWMRPYVLLVLYISIMLLPVYIRYGNVTKLSKESVDCDTIVKF